MLACSDLLASVLVLAMSEAPPGPIAYVIDRSSSMAPRMTYAQLAGRGLVASVDAGSRVLLYTFNDSVAALTPSPVPVPFGPSGHAARRELMDAIGAIRPGGGTNILQAMDEVIAAGATTVILVTDGQQTASYRGVPASRLAPRELVAAQVASAGPGLRVFPVGVGSEVDVPILEHYAAQTDGAFFLVEDSKDLLPVFAQICRILGGTLLSEGPGVTVYPGDAALTIFLAGVRATDADSVRLRSVSQDIALRPGDHVFTARVGDVSIFKFDACPPPGTYEIVCPGAAQIRVLTEKKAPFRLQLDPVSGARTNRPLRVTARIVPLVPDAILPRMGDVRCRLGFDQGDGRQTSPRAGPFAMEQISETEFVWSGWLGSAANPAGTYNARLVGEIGGWTSDSAVAFRVEGSAPSVVISASDSGPLAGPLVLGPLDPGQAIEVPLRLEWRDWPEDEPLSVSADGEGDPIPIPPHAPRWSLRFRAASKPGAYSVRWRFFAEEACVNEAWQTWRLEAAVTVRSREIRASFPEGRDLGALPARIPLRIDVPAGLAPALLRASSNSPSEDLRVRFSPPGGPPGSPELRLQSGENVVFVELEPGPFCPPGRAVCEVVLRPDDPGLVLTIDGELTDRAQLAGTVGVQRVCVDFSLEEGPGIEKRGDAAGAFSFPAPRALRWAIALSPPAPEFAECLVLDCRVPASGWHASVERRESGLVLEVRPPPALAPGRYEIRAAVGHRLPRVRVEPSEISLAIDVRRPRVRMAVYDGDRRVGPRLAFWETLTVSLRPERPVRRDGLRLRLTSPDADGVPVCVRGPIVRPEGAPGDAGLRSSGASAGPPLFAGCLRIAACEDVPLGPLELPGPGAWSVLVPVQSEIAFEPECEPGAWDPGGAFVLPTIVRRFPRDELLAALAGLACVGAAALCLRHRRRNPIVRLSLALVDGPDGSWIASRGIRSSKGGEPIAVKGRPFSRRTIRIGFGGDVAIGGAASPRAGVRIRRKRGTYLVETLSGEDGAVQLVRSGAARSASGSVLEDGDEIRFGEFRILVRAPARIRSRVDARRIRRGDATWAAVPDRTRVRRVRRAWPGAAGL